MTYEDLDAFREKSLVDLSDLLDWVEVPDTKEMLDMVEVPDMVDVPDMAAVLFDGQLLPWRSDIEWMPSLENFPEHKWKHLKAVYLPSNVQTFCLADRRRPGELQCTVQQKRHAKYSRRTAISQQVRSTVYSKSARQRLVSPETRA